MTAVIVVLTFWGLFKGLYDANIFASVYDVMPPQVRGTAAGFINMMGWLGGGAAPVMIGLDCGTHRPQPGDLTFRLCLRGRGSASAYGYNLFHPPGRRTS